MFRSVTNKGELTLTILWEEKMHEGPSKFLTFQTMIRNLLFYHYKWWLHSTVIPVCNDPEALMLPKMQQDFFIDDHRWNSDQHALPDTWQITQVEDIVKLGWGWQHFYLQKEKKSLKICAKKFLFKYQTLHIMSSTNSTVL